MIPLVRKIHIGLNQPQEAQVGDRCKLCLPRSQCHAQIMLSPKPRLHQAYHSKYSYTIIECRAHVQHQITMAVNYIFYMHINVLNLRLNYHISRHSCRRAVNPTEPKDQRRRQRQLQFLKFLGCPSTFPLLPIPLFFLSLSILFPYNSFYSLPAPTTAEELGTRTGSPQKARIILAPNSPHPNPTRNKGLARSKGLGAREKDREGEVRVREIKDTKQKKKN